VNENKQLSMQGIVHKKIRTQNISNDVTQNVFNDVVVASNKH